MEILMKLKCSPATTAASSTQHPSHKMVDNHRQLQQQQHIAANHSTRMQLPLTSSLPSVPLRPPGMLLHPPPPATLPPLTATQELLLPHCMEYGTTAAALDCCSAAHQDIIDMQWQHAGGGSNRGRNNSSLQQLPPPRREHCLDFVHSMYAPPPQHLQQQNSTPTSVNSAACCASFEPPSCCSALSYRTLNNLMAPSIQPQLQQNSQQQLQHMRLHQLPTMPHMTEDNNNSCVYHEPDENFVSIDDAKIKNFLLKVGEREKQRREQVAKAQQIKSQEAVVYEIIELDDEKPSTIAAAAAADVSSKCAPTPKETEKPISKKSSSPSKEKIVARIDLLDSSSSSESEAADDDEEKEQEQEQKELPLVVAGALSCELQCEVVTEKEKETKEKSCRNSKSGDEIVFLNSDDEEENVDFIDEQEEGVELRWDDLDESRERTFYECFLCGKKVQSSYNLRRHMMIHTGERPFGCDMCDRRFREFSDLKKHRRRHNHQSNFLCMICRLNSPTEHDPTRCHSCDSKNVAVLTAMRPQLISSPEKSQTPPVAGKNNSNNNNNRLTKPLTPTPPPTTPSLSGEIPKKSVSPPSLPPLTPIATTISSSNDAAHRSFKQQQPQQPQPQQQGALTRKEFPCPLCQRCFGTRHNLKRHFMIHTGEKPFSCPKCRKPFREYSTLKKHLVTHKRDRWYKCHQCIYKSRDYIEYTGHKSTHPQSEATSGGSGSGSNSPLKKRTKSKHDDSYDSLEEEEDSASEDWLECCECGHRFTDIEAYTEHLKEHDSSVFLYECYICKQIFSERNVLIKHMTAHNEEKEQESTKANNNKV